MTDDVLLVHGGTPLEGEIHVRGAKNLVPKAMVAALLGSRPSRLRNVPDIRDVRVVRGLLQLHGATVRSGDEPGELILDPSRVDSANVADIDAEAGRDLDVRKAQGGRGYHLTIPFCQESSRSRSRNSTVISVEQASAITSSAA